MHASLVRTAFWTILLCVCAFVGTGVPADLPPTTFRNMQQAATSGNGTVAPLDGFYSTLTVQINGSSGANRTVSFEGRQDQSKAFVSILCADASVGTLSVTTDTTSNLDQVWLCPVVGLKEFRVPISGGTTGTVSISGTASIGITLIGSAGGGGGGTGASTSDHFVTTRAESDLSAEFNLGSLASGILKHTVASSISTPATAIAGTDYVAPGAATTSGLTIATARLAGRTTAGAGAIEEIAVSGCTLSSGTLTCTGSGDITDVWGCTTGNCNALTAAAGDTLDATLADSTQPIKAGTTPPTTCVANKELFIDTDTPVQATPLICNPTGDGWLNFAGGLPDPGDDGIVVRSGTLTLNRSLAVGTHFSVTNATGVAGNPTVNLNLTDVTTDNASASKHGFLPKLSGNSTDCLRGDGSYSGCSAGGGAGTAGSPLFVQVASATAITGSSETSLINSAGAFGTLTIPANWFTAAGTVLDVRFSGKYSTGAVPGTLQLKFKFGSTVVAQTAAFTPIVNVTDGVYSGFIRLIARTVGSSGTIFVADGLLTTGATLTPGEVIFSNPTLGTAVTIDTTVAQTVDLTATWGTASTNSITGYTFELVGPGSAVSSVNGQTGAVVTAAPQNVRLSLTTGVPFTTSDVTAATSVFVMPYKGNMLAFFDDGTNLVQHTFTEQTVTVPSTTNSLHTIYCYWTGSAVSCFASAAWTDSSAGASSRGTGEAQLTTQAGVLVNANAISGKCGAKACTYYGDIRTTGTSGQTEDSGLATVPAKRLVYNYYNRKLRPVRVLEPANSWVYSTNTMRQANGNAANQVEYVCGVAGECSVDLSVKSSGSVDTANRGLIAAIGRNSTTAALSGVVGLQINVSVINILTRADAQLQDSSPLGYNYYAWLEQPAGSGTYTWYGDNGTPATIQSGMSGMVEN